MAPAVLEAKVAIPKLSTDLLHFEKDSKHLFFVPDIPNWIVVNQNNAILLFSCDGKLSTNEILDSVNVPSESREDAQILFEEAQKRGVIENAYTNASEEESTEH